VLIKKHLSLTHAKYHQTVHFHRLIDKGNVFLNVFFYAILT